MTLMYPPVGGAYKNSTVIVGQSGNSYSPSLGAQTVPDSDVLALLADGWSIRQSGAVSAVTSTGGTITVTNPNGPTVNVEVSGSSVVNSITASPATSQNDYSPTGYVGSTTNRLLLAAASGGSTLTGLSAVGVADGFTVLIQNTSATDVLIFPHLGAGSSSANQFTNQNAVSVQIPPLGAARATYIVNKWQFT